MKNNSRSISPGALIPPRGAFICVSLSREKERERERERERGREGGRERENTEILWFDWLVKRASYLFNLSNYVYISVTLMVSWLHLDYVVI